MQACQDKSSLSSIELQIPENVLKWNELDGKIIASCKWFLPNFQCNHEVPLLSQEFQAGKNKELNWQLKLDPVCKTAFCCFGQHSMHLQIKCREANSVKFYYKVAITDKTLKEEVCKNFEEEETNQHVKIKFDPSIWLPNNPLIFLVKILAVKTQNSNQKLANFEQLSLTPREKNAENSLEHIENEFDDFEVLLENGMFSDIVLEMNNGKKLKAHKNILAARSPIFFEMLATDAKKNTFEIEIKDVDYEIMKEILSFMYTGKIKNIKQEAISILVAANKFALHTLSTRCQETLSESVQVENAFEILLLADSCKAKKLKARAIDIIMDNLSKYDDSQFKTLSHTLLVEVLSSLSRKQNPNWTFNNKIMPWSFGASATSQT